MSTQNAIQLSGVSKTFDGFKALSDADFTARWGEVHALLGENGAGKSPASMVPKADRCSSTTTQ